MARPYEKHTFDWESPDREIRAAQNRVTDQEAHVRRLIVHGAPTQAAEDCLRQLEQNLARLETVHRLGKPLG